MRETPSERNVQLRTGVLVGEGLLGTARLAKEQESHKGSGLKGRNRV